MPRKRTAEEAKQYMADYRARQRLEIGGTVKESHMEGDVRVIEEIELMEVSLVSVTDMDAHRAAGGGWITHVDGVPLVPDVPGPQEEAVMELLDTIPGVRTDRERGLPRSNYFSDHKAPGGWTEVIQNIDPKLATKILDRIAPPRRQR